MAWVCDFTYIRAGGRFYYLCAIMDLFSRRIIAFRLSARINTDLAIATLEDAIRARGVSSGVMFHTDRGSQFTAKRFRQYLDQHGMIQSFSAKGYPYDNAVMECFFRYLKHEETNRRSYASLAELQVALFRYIHGFYNVLLRILITMGFHPLRLKRLVLSSLFFSVYFIDIGPGLTNQRERSQGRGGTGEKPKEGREM